MKTSCDIVAERVALGEELGDVAEHAASCARCRRLVALPAELGAVHHESDPGVGFSSRMTVGAQHKIVARRRRRIVLGVGSALAVAAGGVFFVTRASEQPQQVAGQAKEEPRPAGQHQQPPAPEPGAVDAEVKALVQLANVDHSAHVSANWARITKPLGAYRALVKGITP
jgi:hypothetical protein